ncbi:hypothetical protein [Nocardioides marmorisolisilvae]|uniref:Uncharacterized protein n=1 Tax=Nocardioides marmorisolisilvae TaxID=1542737 RepID=A0A3N0DU52_9ACTN|nr:hypothetical protein [Nocardioides marmorisolisilvae]RNL79152.1 hypothetical protein EFL95_08960 [Nocardioides marmorisolisilvae]
MSVLQVVPVETAVEHDYLAEVIRLVPQHDHTWALRDTEYDNGLTLHRFECDGCSAVRFT